MLTRAMAFEAKTLSRRHLLMVRRRHTRNAIFDGRVGGTGNAREHPREAGEGRQSHVAVSQESHGEDPDSSEKQAGRMWPLSSTKGHPAPVENEDGLRLSGVVAPRCTGPGRGSLPQCLRQRRNLVRCGPRAPADTSSIPPQRKVE